MVAHDERALIGHVRALELEEDLVLAAEVQELRKLAVEQTEALLHDLEARFPLVVKEEK